MKIAFFVPILYPAKDGVGEYTWYLAQALRASGHEVYIFTSRGNQISEGSEDWVFSVISNWSSEWIGQTVKDYQNLNPDWCVFQYVPHYFGRFGLAPRIYEVPKKIKRLWKKTKFCVTVHELASDWKWHPRDFILAALLRFQARKMLKESDLAVTTCCRYLKNIRDLMEGQFPIEVIPVSTNVDVAPFSNEKREALIKRYGLREVKVLGLFGRLSLFKNYPLALKTLAQAKEKGIKAKLMMLGTAEASNPELFKKIMKLAVSLNIECDMIVPGELSEEDLSYHLQLLDVFLFPQYDGVSTRSTTFISALAHNLPIIAFEPYVGNYEGYKVPVGKLAPGKNENRFTEEALSLLSSEGLEENLNRSYYLENFSWERIRDRWVEVFEKYSESEKLKGSELL